MNSVAVVYVKMSLNVRICHTKVHINTIGGKNGAWQQQLISNEQNKDYHRCYLLELFVKILLVLSTKY